MTIAFNRHDETGYISPLAGIRQKTVVYGERTLMTRFHLDKGSDLPLHSHPYEQTGCLISGRLRLTIGAEQYDACPGDAWNIAAGLDHGAEIIDDSIALEVFSPVREDYLPGRNREK
ncbi:MAG TPA: cupin domain-containing protein [Deltaproteobacteria bacterium]|nr:cupin domain-containing protein [Deltaproteobacteria bacterium]